MTRDEYQRICARLARKANRYAAKMVATFDGKQVDCPKCKRRAGQHCLFTNSGHDAPEGFMHNERVVAVVIAQREHWIDVFLHEQLPDIDPDVLLAVSNHTDAWWVKVLGHGDKTIRANAAFQADVGAAIHLEGA